MTKRIYKYPLTVLTGQRPFGLLLPQGAEFLRVTIQNGSPFAWFLVLPESTVIERTFYFYGTGQDIPLSHKYLGTFERDAFVIHMFEKI